MATVLEKESVGGQALGFMLVKSCEKKTTQKKTEYLDMVLSDSGGEIVAKLWDYSPAKCDVFPSGTIVKVKGSIDVWNNSPQLKVDKIREANFADDVKMEDLVCSAQYSGEEMFKELEDTARNFDNADISKIVIYLLNENKDAVIGASAALRMHHTMRSGLLYHTLSMLRVGKALCSVYPFLDKDLVYAGIIIHDLGKTNELKYNDAGIASEYTPRGNMIGHIIGGAVNIAMAGEKLGIDPEIVMQLQHMVISHHGIPEFGSPIPPMFPEAQVVSTIDKLDAEMFEMLSALGGVEKGQMTNRVFGLDRKLYKIGDDSEYRLS